jgi:hypothetical protein
MAEALYLVTKDQLGGAESLVNGVSAVLINADDAQTNNQIIASAVAAANSSVGATGAVASAFHASYFTTVTKVSDLSAGPLKDNLDAYVFSKGGPALVKVEGP